MSNQNWFIPGQTTLSDSATRSAIPKEFDLLQQRIASGFQGSKDYVDAGITAASYGIAGAVDNYGDLPDPTSVAEHTIYIVRNSLGAPSGNGLYWVLSGAWVFLDSLNLQDAGEVPYDNTVSTIPETNVQDALDYIWSYAETHVLRVDNPHNVTKTQVGLGNVTNDIQLKAASNLADLSDIILARMNLGLGNSATRNVGSVAGTVCAGDDPRLGSGGGESYFTPLGGFAIKLIAGEAVAEGDVVYPRQAGGADGKVWKTLPDSDMPIGVVYADVAQNADVWVVVAGKARVKPKSTITAARGNVIFCSDETGRVDQAPVIPLQQHWREVGHWLSDGTGAGVLSLAVVHFN